MVKLTRVWIHAPIAALLEVYRWALLEVYRWALLEVYRWALLEVYRSPAILRIFKSFLPKSE